MLGRSPGTANGISGRPWIKIPRPSGATLAPCAAAVVRPAGLAPRQLTQRHFAGARIEYRADVPRPTVVPATPLSPAEKLQMSLDMFDYGCEVMRATLQRRHPNLAEAEVQELLLAWLRDRPGAPDGDGVGRARVWQPQRP